MSTATHQTELPPGVRRMLDDVRWRIRAYVWVESLALVVVLLGAAFWIGLAVDWMFEPSPRTRQIGLAVLGLATLFVCYRYLLRRLWVTITDTSAAALLERRFPTLGEHVLTAVDVAALPERARTYHPEFVSKTQHAATRAVANIRPGDLFNRRPLLRAVGLAAALVVSIAFFSLLARDVFSFWLERIALSDAPWPRRVQLQVVGFPPDAAGRRVHKLAQDDDFELVVQAQAKDFEVPDEVEIRFRLADGGHGRDTMIRVGEASAGNDGLQLFRYQFKRVAGDMEFDVVGGDDRVRDLQLQVVERPELFAIELECEFPEYLQREPRRLPMTGGMRIPEGTRLVLHAGATKPLTAASVHKSNEKEDAELEFSDRPQEELRWEYGTLAADDVLMVSATDTDGVSTREPYRISLAVVKDELPQVAVRLAGIGSAITPEAVLPFTGKVTDDYGLDRAWYAYSVDAGAAGERPLAVQTAGEPLLENLGQFDLRATDEATGKRALELKPGQRLLLALKASDRFDLSDEPRAGSSQQFALDVVTAIDLLALLERRELALRQRYEAIYEKVTDTRNLLGRVDFNDAENDPADPTMSQPDASTAADEAAADTSSATIRRALARRRLRVAGSLQNIVQSADEIGGVAEAFDDLDAQLTNNRIDNPDLQSRLREQIAVPLRRIAEQRMPALAAQLKLVEETIENAAAAEPELTKSIALADEILVEMRQVLDRMLELETYNEVVALLRDIITDQDEINRRTKDRQKERLRSLFEE